MRLVLLAAAAVALSGSAAFAGEEIMAGYFGNTVVATSQQGEMKVRYKPDHSFSGKAQGPLGAYDIHGTWSLDDKGMLCRKYNVAPGEQLPPGTPNPYCSPAQAHNVGDTWMVTDQMGRSAQVKLVAGK